MDSQLLCEFQSLAGSETGCCEGSSSQLELGGLGSGAPRSVGAPLRIVAPTSHKSPEV